VPAADYAQWRERLLAGQRVAARIDEVEIVGLGRVDPRAVARHLQQQPGVPLDTTRLNRDLLRAYGDGYYESVDYSLLTLHGRNVLRVLPLEKSWGPDYLRLAVNLNTNLLQGSTYGLRAGYQKTWLNRLGGELLFSAEVGSNQGATAEWYQPLDGAQRVFMQTAVTLRRERADIFAAGNRIAEYRISSGTLALTGGINIGLLGQAQLGWRETRRSASVETGLPVLPTEPENFGGWLATLDLDQLNRLYFPTRGWAARVSYFESPRRDYSRLASELRAVLPFGDTVFGTRLAHASSPRGSLPVFDAAPLGGFLNLSGFAAGQLLGDSTSYAHVRAERILGRLPLGLRGDLRLGLALEAGRIGGAYTEVRRTGWLNSMTLYLGGETPFGPVYAGVGHSTSGSTNAYLFIGTP